MSNEIARRYLTQRLTPTGAAQSAKLHLGCGVNLLPGWLNTDSHPQHPEVMQLDATARMPFEDGTFDYIFSEHMIEHIPFAAGLMMLAECRRLLKPSGVLRISTPDFAFLVGLTQPGKSELQHNYVQWIMRSLMPGLPEDNPIFVINNFVRAWGHAFIYDERTLRDAMVRVGFTNITRHQLQHSNVIELCGLENEARMPPGFLQLESFTLEAVR